MRKATESDIPRLLEIEVATQIAPWSEEVFQRCFQMRYECWVIEEENNIIAFLMMSSSITQESHILDLCVDPDYQRKGHGKVLLNYAIAQAKLKGIGIVYLEVRRSNRNAIMLYHKTGFVQISERKNYYPTPKGREDALVFAKDLGVHNENEFNPNIKG